MNQTEPSPPTLEAGAVYEIPVEGSLGLLALGARGLQTWRQKRAEASGEAIPHVKPPEPREGPRITWRQRVERLARGRKRLAKRVLLIGWDAADWKMINPLMDAGQMPALDQFVNEGGDGQYRHP